MSGRHIFKSTVIGLIFCGKWQHILTPWQIEIDLRTKYVFISKRNWYLIGVDIEQHKINSIRFVKVDNSIFGSDVHIKVFYNSFSVFGLSNSDAKRVRELITSNQ